MNAEVGADDVEKLEADCLDSDGLLAGGWRLPWGTR